MTKRKKTASKLVAYLTSMILLLLTVFFLFNIAQGYVQNASLRKSLQEVKSQLAELEDENQMLVEQKEKLADPEYVKNYARGRYMLSQDNEQIFRLPGGNK